MRIVQIIDSLDAGGAERMAVNYANSLAPTLAFSGLVATRAEGPLLSELDPKVGYLFLQKKKTVDLKAALRLKEYCRDNKINFLHAHSSSYFIALLTKMMLPRLRIIWHDHNGMSEFLKQRPTTALKLASYFFSAIIVVNNLLEIWAKSNLKCKNVVYLPNFAAEPQVKFAGDFEMKGTAGKRILCLANLRPQKNHPMLLDVAALVKERFPDWTFHLVGKDFGDVYSATIKSRIIAENLQENVFLYGSVSDTHTAIVGCEISVITSVSEGLPVSVLECGAASKAVVVTNVGELASVVTDRTSGFVVESGDSGRFADAVIALIQNPDLRSSYGKALQIAVSQGYSAHAVMGRYRQLLEKIKNV